ncbi:PAS domain S-box protein [Roseomonas gilardii]|uniref:PAS domain S-box protein n=1 Tax=Roseomonas gilardii TaxID=257708 RepID=UPI00047FC17A|nr:PAS domain S-box protein [Roseomonas gilardii]SUE43055.1 PAS domain S-box protein [Roseomonas gilardii subsp. rosea]
MPVHHSLHVALTRELCDFVAHLVASGRYQSSSEVVRKVPHPSQLSPGRLAELVLESSADFGILSTDLDGIITSWNSSAEAIMGWSADEAIGQDACMIFTPEDQASGGCAEEMAIARRKGRAADERWHLRRDGSRFWGGGLHDAAGGHGDRCAYRLSSDIMLVSDFQARVACSASAAGRASRASPT